MITLLTFYVLRVYALMPRPLAAIRKHTRKLTLSSSVEGEFGVMKRPLINDRKLSHMLEGRRNPQAWGGNLSQGSSERVHTSIG